MNGATGAEMEASPINSILEQERTDGVRFVWNCWPNSKEAASRMIVPLGVFLTPVKPRPDMPPFNYEPVYCMKCRAVLNPYNHADFRAKTWICCFCSHRNPLDWFRCIGLALQFPQHYSGATDQLRPAEMLPQFTVMEYILPRPTMPPIFLFVVDTCMEEDDLRSLKDSLTYALSTLPENSLVGLVSFGRTVAVHDLSMDLIKHSYVFKGTKDITAKQLQDLLGIGRYSGTLQPLHQSQHSGGKKFPNRFIQPIETCGKFMADIIASIPEDPWPIATGKRALRSTGAALNIAVGLVENSFPGTGARIMLFIAGPCTCGPGMVVGDDFKIPIRSHHDIVTDNASHVERSTKYFSTLAHRAAANSHAIDIFSSALDQTGLHEMKLCCNITGGQMLLCDSFRSELFTRNMQVLFSRDKFGELPMAFNANIEIKASQHAVVSGCLGPVSPLNVKSSTVSENDLMGTGGTAEWKCCGLFQNTTLCFCFEVANETPTSPSEKSHFYLQFITNFQHSSGQKRVRVITASRTWENGNSPNMSAGFDQEAASVLLARLAVTRPGADIQRWIDRTLIRTCSRFGLYMASDPSTFRLADNFALLPSYMFHLRRSQLLQNSNTSLDESAFYRHCLLKQDVMSGSIIMQPVLYAYSLDGPPALVSLDVSSLQADRILLLDTFFHIVIYRGETIVRWAEAGYDRMPEYANLASLLKAPLEDAEMILSTRFPMPRYVLTEEGGSQARFLLSKVNPSKSQTIRGYSYSAEQDAVTPVLTDDVSLQVFMDHLRKLAVSAGQV